MKLRGLWLGLLLLAAGISQAQTDVLVSHNDAGRTGQNLNEPTLTLPNLSAATFGKVYAYRLDGYTYAQPLYKSNLTLPGLGTFNVVFAATEHGSIYALDADSATPLWQRSFINPAAGLTTRTTNPAQEDIVPEVSITSTPVIDAASGTLYVVAETVQSGSPALYWLHAIDITTGADKVPPVSIAASVGTGNGPFHIDAPTSQQRAGLFLSNGVVYIGFGSSGDSFPWVGWLLGYNATTLAQVSVFCASGAGANGAGVWGSGEAPAVDASGNIYFSTGNGVFSSSANSWADTFLKLSTASGLAIADYFAPFNATALGNADLDVAAAGVTLLPDAAGSAAHPHLLVGSGKDGEIYLIDRDNMGQFNSSYNTPNSNVVQWIPGQIGTVAVNPTAVPMSYAGNSYTTPAYWQNHVYFCGANDVCKAFTLANGLLSTTPASQAPTSNAYPGSMPVISAASSTATSAVLWAVQRDTANNVTTLHAYDATNLANEVYNSNQAAAGRDHGGAPVKFAVPTVANGKVFVAAQAELDVYGLLGTTAARLAAPGFTPASGSFPGPQAVTLTAAPGATIHYTLDGSPPTLASPTYSAPILVSSATTISAIAVQSGAYTSPAASAGYTIAPPQNIAFVQGTYSTPQSPQSSVGVRYLSAQTAGDLNVVIVGWGDTTATVKSVSDSSGNTYQLAVGPTQLSGTLSQSIWYAKNIAAPGANTVTVAFNGAAIYPDIRILEYQGVDPANPLDVVSGAAGYEATAVTPAVTTTSAHELLLGAEVTTGSTQSAGAGFTARLITVPDADLAEDEIVASAGSYSASAAVSGGQWVMQLATFRAGGAGTPAAPTAPGTLTATPSGVTGMNLAWGAATESGGSIASYLVERCQGAGCSGFAQIGTVNAPATSFADSGLTASTSYSYRVRAKDPSANTGPYSNTASGMTPAATPGAPGALAATASGSTQVNLAWSAATESGGTIAQYLIERCQGAGCSGFVQVGTATTLTFADTGLTSATSYSYRVRAKDAAGATGAYSNTAAATTAAAAPVISMPGALSATASGASQVNLSWGAATETGGTVAQYLIERCQGAGCSSFAQVATTAAPTTTFTDSGLTGSTSYSYRVRAKDAAGNTGPYSNTATATTTAAAPVISAPGALSATPTSATQITVSWGAATETGGSVAQYLIERCQGAGCSSFAQVATTAAPTTTFTDSGLTGSTSYSYRVRAKDTAGNTGPYSNVATTTTGTVAPTISAPGALSSSATGTTQVTLAWGAATETGGTLSQYLIERCQGAGCSGFAQIGTTTVPTAAFVDSGLLAATSYSYRVRAKDAAGNTGPYSNTTTSVTGALAPSAPAALTASAAGSTQVTLAWGAASESGGSIAQYLIERCQGAGCSSFTQVGTATTLSFTDTALTGSTSYAYRVRARDAAGNTGPYSNTASATTAAPAFTAPGSLSAASVSSTQVNLTWGAATETGGSLSQYRIERCQGAGCSTFTQVATASGTSYNDAGLSAATAYSYRVRAADAAGNTGPYSNVASATTASGGGTAPPITFVQTGNATPQSPQTAVSVRFGAAQVAGDLNVVVVGWGDTTAAVGTVTDSSGNVYRLAVGPTAISGTATQAIYYAANIVGAAAAANVVTVTFTGPATYPDIRMAEYSGIDPNNPLDVVSSATGNGATSATPAVATSYANDLLVGANLVQSLTITAGSGFSTRVITSPDGDLLEDRVVTTTGSYSVTANIAPDLWIMQMVAFRRHP